MINISENDNNFNNNPIDNNKIFLYYGDELIINQEIKNNNFYLIKEYRNLHKINEKYNSIPNFLEQKENDFNLDINCPFKKRNFEINNFSNDIIIDNKQLLSSFFKKNDYYNYLPIIFVNSKYYNGFLEYIDKCPKYKKFDKTANINKKFILSSDDNYLYKHSYNKYNSKICIIADIVENVNYYKIEIVVDIINKIKESINISYKQYINELIMTLMDIFVEFFLFILKQKPSYYICPSCNSPLLCIDNIENIKGNNILENKIKNNEFNEYNKIRDFDYSLCKSFDICSSLNELLFKNLNEKKIIELKKNYQNLNLKNIYIPANPPKKGMPSINIIYYDENQTNKYFKDSVNKNAKKFKEASNGTFIFSNSEKNLEIIMEEIKEIKENFPNLKFLLITNGKKFEDIIKFLKEKNYLDLISKACIYCREVKKYENLMDKYKEILEGVFGFSIEVVEFIKNNLSEENIFFKSKLVTYENYISKYYELHKIIAKYYTRNFQNSYNIALSLLRELLDENFDDDEKLITALEVFHENRDYEVIKEYTKNTIYPYFSKWLLNLDNLAYEKAGYFIGGLMYKLNEYGINKNKGNRKNCKLYRGLYLDYLDALSYEIHEGEIISFQTFLSTSLRERVGIFFSKKERTTLEKRQKDFKFSSIIEIDYNWNENLFPLCFDISEISQFRAEREFLFHPFSFFRVKSFILDIDNYTMKLNLETIGKKEILEIPIKLGKKPILNEEENIIEVK